MNIRDGLRKILCNSETGILWNKKLQGKDFKLEFEEHSGADCSQWIEIYYVGKTQYALRNTLSIGWNDRCVDEKEVDEFLKLEYLFKDEEVEIVD